MDSLAEKVAYLKGLAEGLDLGNETKEAKIINGMLDVLEEMSKVVADLEDDHFELTELVDEIDSDLANLEDDVDYLYDNCDCDCDDDDCDCGCEDDEHYYEITCPKCGESIYLDEDSLFEDGVYCPECNEKIEFDLEDCDCDCDDCHCDDCE
ncbi:MAG: hypothetical protein IJC74_01300 [Clostridia bacterium]|nr:hypothetical protein [Clostridia bacterium]